MATTSSRVLPVKPPATLRGCRSLALSQVERRLLRAIHGIVPGRRRRTTDVRRADRTSRMLESARCIVRDRSAPAPFQTRS